MTKAVPPTGLKCHRCGSSELRERPKYSLGDIFKMNPDIERLIGAAPTGPRIPRPPGQFVCCSCHTVIKPTATAKLNP